MTPDEWQTWSSTALALVERDGGMVLDVRYITGDGARAMLAARDVGKLDPDEASVFVAAARILDSIDKNGWNCLICDASGPCPEILVALMPSCDGMSAMGGGICHGCAARGKAWVATGIAGVIGQMVATLPTPAPVVGHA